MSYTRYLAAKKSLDDRSLNQRVWTALQAGLAGRKGPLRVLEIGAGVGTMIERALGWGLFADGQLVNYLAIDNMPSHIAQLEQLVATLALGDVAVSAETIDLYDFLKRPGEAGNWDLIIANAVLDLVNLPEVIPQLLGLLRPDGLIYATINFDGVSTLLPQTDNQLDQQIEALYHETMDKRITDGRPAGDSRSGSQLIQLLHGLDANLLAVGSSDWVVHATDGVYQDNEAYFLQCIVDTMYEALRDDARLDQAALKAWHQRRHQQIDRGQFIYITHQLDVLAGRA